MKPADLKTIETVVVDIGAAIQLIGTLADLAGLDSTSVLKLAKGEPLPPLQPAGPDVAADYEAAKAEAEGKPAP